ncbi:TIGR02450 family Trp-rich protein [Baaleninema simplex]|uniref:TIGR02450 family Trp-rich protein n=1 Tax=Baaleninema simplex TaxID=2862350 RepID=UPI000345CE6D|nr:TIGR02450 family Trp-rich protein [Baaleninema simplex]
MGKKKQKFPHLLGSKWTAVRETWGWRHFQVVSRKNEGDFVFAELMASCDAQVRFWVNAKTLKNPSQWRPGWKSLQEQEELEIPLDVEVLEEWR